MKEACFRYETHKKIYYVDRHEDSDVVSNRISYHDAFFTDEIYEHCWIQITKQKYDSLKQTKGFHIIKIKNRRMVMKIWFQRWTGVSKCDVLNFILLMQTEFKSRWWRFTLIICICIMMRITRETFLCLVPSVDLQVFDYHMVQSSDWYLNKMRPYFAALSSMRAAGLLMESPHSS